MFFTVFTPTYNRADFLPRLYSSLKNQKFTDFEWIIVDDGSTDGTEKIVASLIEAAPFPIKFYKQSNQGKHVAINMGAEHASGVFFFIVDSDDYLTDDSLLINAHYCKQIASEDSLAGVAGLRGYENKEPQIILPKRRSLSYHAALRVIKKEYIDCTYYDLRNRLHIGGDRAEVVKTKILRRHKFLSFPDENFMSEDYLWCQLAEEGYEFRWFNEVTYLGERHDDGLVKNMKNLCLHNPKGMACVNNLISGHRAAGLSQRLRACAVYFKYSYISRKRLFESIKKSHFNKVLALPLGALIYLVIRVNDC